MSCPPEPRGKTPDRMRTTFSWSEVVLFLYLVLNLMGATLPGGTSNAATTIAYTVKKDDSPANPTRSTSSPSIFQDYELSSLDIDQNDIVVDEVADARARMSIDDEVEGVYQSTQVYGPMRSSSMSTGVVSAGDEQRSQVERRRKLKRCAMNMVFVTCEELTEYEGNMSLLEHVVHDRVGVHEYRFNPRLPSRVRHRIQR